MDNEPRLFALRPWDRDIGDLMRDPTVQACHLTSGRVLYFALPIPGKVLTWLNPQELVALYRHLEGTLGLLIHIKGPGTVDYVAMVMLIVLIRLYDAGVPAPASNYIPISLAGIYQNSVTGNSNPHMISWINSGFQGHPLAPFQHYPALPHPLFSGIDDETGLVRQGIVNPECVHYWKAVMRLTPNDYEGFVHGVYDLLHDPLCQGMYVPIPGPEHPERDAFFAWKEHDRYNGHDSNTLWVVHSLSGSASSVLRPANIDRTTHQKARNIEYDQDPEFRQKARFHVDVEHQKAPNTRLVRSLESRSESTSSKVTTNIPPRSSISEGTPSELKPLEEMIKMLEREERGLRYEVNADNEGHLDDVPIVKHCKEMAFFYTRVQPEWLYVYDRSRPHAKWYSLLFPVQPKEQKEVFNPLESGYRGATSSERSKLHEPKDTKVVERYREFRRSLFRYLDYLAAIGYTVTREELRILLFGGRQPMRYRIWLFSLTEKDLDILYRHMLQFQPTREIKVDPFFGKLAHFLRSMNRTQLFLYCIGLFDVTANSSPEGLHIMYPSFPEGRMFTGRTWMEILSRHIPTSDVNLWLLTLRAGKLEDFFDRCYRRAVRQIESDSKTKRDHISLQNRLVYEESSKDSWTEAKSAQSCSGSIQKHSDPSWQNATKTDFKSHNSDAQFPESDRLESSLTAFVDTLTDYELSLVLGNVMSIERDDSELGWQLVPIARRASPVQKENKTSVKPSPEPARETASSSGSNNSAFANRLTKEDHPHSSNTSSKIPRNESSKKADKRSATHDIPGWDHDLYEDLLALDTDRLHRTYEELVEGPLISPSARLTPLPTPLVSRNYNSTPSSGRPSRSTSQRPQYENSLARISSTRDLRAEMDEDWTYIIESLDSLSDVRQYYRDFDVGVREGWGSGVKDV
jgi:hypothetical protein